ncbi:MAG: NADH-quinone oxidoreductase subunit J [Candidatus Krumholzibacteria bacterium]|jgi:NADH-quinone oxidoreductase subunit J|nr:NADH-quinone oxidoreductase subunit J [Candidatus Krumholzibacteria bacterium]
METFLFFFGGAVLLSGGIAVVASRSAVNAACWLVFAFLGAAGLFAALHAPFLAVLQVLVYAGAVMVLFLFVIMMLEGPVMPGESRRPRLRLPLLAMAPAVVMAVVASHALRTAAPAGFATVLPDGFGQPLRVSWLLLQDYVFAFQMIAILLLVAMVGALALGRSERKRPWL